MLWSGFLFQEKDKNEALIKENYYYVFKNQVINFLEPQHRANIVIKMAKDASTIDPKVLSEFQGVIKKATALAEDGAFGEAIKFL